MTCNNTDGNKLVIFSGIALYYGDTYIIADICQILKCHVTAPPIYGDTCIIRGNFNLPLWRVRDGPAQ